MTTAEKIAKLLDEAPIGPGLPVIFNGVEPRYLGRSKSIRCGVDSLLLANRLSATYISHARLQSDGREFYVAHG